MNIQILSFILVALLSGYLTFLLVPVVRSYCIRKGILDHPGPRKIHATPMPRMGGVAFVASFMVAIWLGFALDPKLWLIHWVGMFGIMAGGAIIFTLGLADDLAGMGPFAKLLWQVAAALPPVLCGIRLEILNIPFYHVVNIGYLGIPLSIIWIVAITNTFNLLDGLDGLAAGIAAITALTFVILSVVMNLPLASLLAAGIFGISTAFLRFNFHPAKIFMGDSGSLFIGYIFGVLSLYWPKSSASLVMFVPLLALGVPLLEMATTTIRRVATGKKIYMADRRHLFHYLLEMGFPQTTVVLFFYLVSFQFSIVAMGFVLKTSNIVLVLEVIFIILIAIILSRNIKSGGGNGR